MTVTLSSAGLMKPRHDVKAVSLCACSVKLEIIKVLIENERDIICNQSKSLVNMGLLAGPG